MPSDHPVQHTYPPAGQCIYCGTTEGDLSREHILPYVLGGTLVLPKASCMACQKVTQKIEEVCTFERWGMFSHLRAKLKMPSRRPWKDRTSISTEVLRENGKNEIEQFEASSFPAAANGVRFPDTTSSSAIKSDAVGFEAESRVAPNLAAI